MKTKSTESKKKVLLLITGSIAAVRIPILVSQLSKENYEIFPEGSLFASYGTITAPNKNILMKKLLDKKLLNSSVLNYKPLIKHKMNLSVFKK